MYTKNYITTETYYSEYVAEQRSNWLGVRFLAYKDGDKELETIIYTYDHEKQEKHFQGTLNELIELILLGKLHKAQLQAESKKEPVIKCDLCPNPAEWFESPLGNPDEPKMCDPCYRKNIEPGARDWDAHHIPLNTVPASEIRELQNNG